MVDYEAMVALSKHVFFSAMKAGWAGDQVEKKHDPEDSSWKTFVYREADWEVIDRYRANGDASAGNTTIYLNCMPIWTMHYGGRYPKDAIPFLKSVLMLDYDFERRFWGGRGPEGPIISDPILGGVLVYLNKIFANDFADFFGRETISLQKTGAGVVVIGYHWYKGGLLSLNGEHPFRH